MSWLGLDLGTSGVKALLLGRGGAVVAEASAPLDVARPCPGWSEQAPADWIAATRIVLSDLARRADLGDVRGIGLSGQMHGAVLLDAGGRVLRPAILWNDTRAHREAAELDARAIFRAQTGNIVFPGFTAPKLLWVARHEPGTFDSVDKVLLPKDYLRFWLTGEHISDMSDASGTAWLDVGARDWSAELLAASGMSPAQMPALAEGSARAGRLRAALADETGLPAGIPVAGGGGDNAASACGIGAVGTGGFASLGTSGVLFAATERFRPNADSAVHAFCHALPGAWHQMGVILSAADALAWWGRVTGLTPQALTEEAGTHKAPGGPLFLPYLSGERTPHNDAAIRGQFLHLSHGDDRPALTRAVLDGVAFAFRDSLDALRGAGTDLTRVMAIGGGAASRLWLQTLATATGLTLDLPGAGEHGAALGAARLGLCAAEGADPLEICTPPPVADTIAPDPALLGAYAAQLGRYRTAYTLLKGFST